MTTPEEDEDLSDLLDLCRGITVRSWEAELRRKAAMAPPGQYPSVPVLRALNELNSIESRRRSSITRLRAHTRELDVGRIERLKRAGILDALIDLQTYRWCPDDLAREAHEIVVNSLTKASDEQVRYLAEKGCIRALCEAQRDAAVLAIKRVLEVGKAGRAESGRNLYADQLRAHGCLDRLKRLRQQDEARGAAGEEIDQIIMRFFETPASQSTGEGSQDRSDRGLGWRLLYPFFKHRRFPKWNREEAAEVAVEETCPLATKLFISHRWATPDDPDPRGKHLPTVVEYLTRVFMVASGFIGEDSFVVKELVIGDGLRAAFRESRLDLCRCGSIGWLDVRALLEYDDLFFDKVTDIHRRRNFYRLLKHVRVWYDYSSLPQARGTREEEEFLDRALTRLAEIVGRSEVITLWGLESINRAWCIFEVLAAKTVHFCPPGSGSTGGTDKSLVKALMKWAASGDDSDRAEELAAYRGRPSLSVLITVNQFRQGVAGLSEQEIHEYFLKNGIQCTKATDLVRLSKLIHRYLTEHHEADERESPDADR
jgi:hypothetical protein